MVLRATEKITLAPQFLAASGRRFRALIVQAEDMYQYDAIGNLILDQAEGTKVTWTPYGKVRTVSTQSDTVVTTFRYDGAGNRIEKRVVTNDTLVSITRYLRDASGNVMAIYQDSTLHEQPIYGSSRLGQYQGGAVTACLTLGTRRYELSNHLGNVLTVITDNIGMSADTTWATVVSASDYYPFGLTMAGRDYQDSLYRYGFNGKEKDDRGEWGSTNYDYGFRIYSPKIGKFLSIDPLAEKFPMITPYAYAFNNPIRYTDPTGMEGEDGTDPGKIKKAAKKVASEIPGSEAQCSHGCRELLLEVTGSKELFAKGPIEWNEFHDPEGGMEAGKTRANDMAAHMEKSDNFQKFDDISGAMKAADEGELVFAVFHNKKGTGHVNVILGGEKEPGTWEGEVMDLPMVFDTGINKRWPNESTPRNKRKISNAFGSDKHSSVIFYKYVGGQDNKIYPGPTLKPVVIQGKRLGSGYLKPIGISGLQ